MAKTKIGSGELMLASQDTYFGQTTIAGGTLQLGADHALLAAAFVATGDAAPESGALDLDGHEQASEKGPGEAGGIRVRPPR